MFRSPQPGDWAAEDDDTAPLPTPVAPTSPTPAEAAAMAAAPARSAPSAPRSQDVRGGRFDRDRNNGGGRFDRDRDNSGGRFDRGGGGRFERDGGRQEGGGRFERDGGRFERDGGRFERDGGRQEGGGRFERDGGRFDRDEGRQEGGARFERDNGRQEGGGRADASRWGHFKDRRNDSVGRGGGGADMPVEQGFVVAIKESFGFVSCMGRDGDLFFHMSEAPVDVQLQDEMEFRVKFNQRSDKEMACQLVALPKGSIKVEEVADEVVEGVVTKSLPRGHGGGRAFFGRDDDRRQRDEHGLIEVKKPQEAQDEQEEENAEAPEAKKTLPKREFVRFNSESVAAVEAAEGDAKQPKKNPLPHFGDEVRFRIAKHRKTGAKRAVDMTVTVSARDKLDEEIEAKLASLTREKGVVDRVKSGGGFIKCCDRPVDIYFPFHEVREPQQETEDGQQTDEKPQRQGKPGLREGDEVSFFVLEDREEDSARSRPRLTALRVQKLPPGSVSFEDLVRADVEGLVSKLPKEPRNGPEVVGSIAVAADPSVVDETTEADVEAAPESEEKPRTKKKGKDKKLKVAFRLCDTEDMSYVPHIEDKVRFDQVLDKRTGKLKAVKVRVVQLNPKHRETGVINAMKEDFGFIKCAERAGDAYFRFSDVMGTARNFSNGTEVAFDVVADNKSDHIRGTRLQILPRGTIKWQDVVAQGLEGKIVSLPSSRRGHHSTRGGRGDKTKQLPKLVPGKINFVTPEKQHLLDFLPELKEKVDAAFLTTDDAVDEQPEAVEIESTGEEEEAEEKKSKTEIRVSFPSSLSKFERAALHEYSDWLGLSHGSQGEGPHRHLEIFGDEKIATKTVEDKLVASAPQLTVEFKEDDVEDVRYNPRVGDRVKFDLAVVKRTKQFQCTAISCVEAVSAKTKAKAQAPVETEASKSEGVIVTVKPEGFGFIQPALTTAGVMEENLFFHIKEITTGQTLAELKEGTEVQYTPFYDEKKKKKRATNIAVVPAGTIKRVVLASVKGVVTKASFLHRLKGGAKGRFMKNSATKASTLGQIRLAIDDADEDEAGSDEEADSEDEADESTEEKAAETEAGDAQAEAKHAPETKKADKKAHKASYLYNIRDIVDPTVVLREGDEVEFVPQMTPKNPRAAQIRLVVSHAKQGVVTRLDEDLGGVIQLDGEEKEPTIEAHFTARNVLRGDVLSEGDVVEFSYKLPSATGFKKVAAKEDEETKDENSEGKATPADAVLGRATSVLRLASSNADATSTRRGSRSVNSTLKEAMRQVGANAMVASRMAKGPDGTRGFGEGWNSDSKDDAEPSTETTTSTVETETSTVTTRTSTEEIET